MKTLLHWWRLLVAPDHDGLLALQPRRWYVAYHDGGRTVPMGYRTACNYAEIFGGDVIRYVERAK